MLNSGYSFIRRLVDILSICILGIVVAVLLLTSYTVKANNLYKDDQAYAKYVKRHLIKN